MNTASPLPQATLAGKIITQLIGAIVFVAVPCLATMIAPVSWVNFSRTGKNVNMQADTCFLFFIPFKTQRVSEVSAIERDFRAGTKVGSRGEDRFRVSESEAFMIVKGLDQQAKVPVSPVDIEETLEKATDFLHTSSLTSLSLFVVANWKFSVIMGGALSLLTAFYVTTIAFGLIFLPLRRKRR